MDPPSRRELSFYILLFLRACIVIVVFVLKTKLSSGKREKSKPSIVPRACIWLLNRKSGRIQILPKFVRATHVNFAIRIRIVVSGSNWGKIKNRRTKTASVRVQLSNSVLHPVEGAEIRPPYTAFRTKFKKKLSHCACICSTISRCFR